MRITELPVTTEPGVTDYLAIDNTINGTRKILASDLSPSGFVSYADDQTSIIDSTDAARARSNIKIISGTTSAEGLVQLYNGIDSNSTTLAATAASVKAAYEHCYGENILDNWYFLNPVNQRGQSTYTGNVYTVDRWLLSTTGITANVLSSGLQIVTSSGVNGRIIQRFPSGLYRGVMLTASLLLSNGTMQTGSAITPTANGSSVSFTTGYPEINFVTASTYDYLEIKFPASTSSIVIAVKLEVGSVQTLCYKSGSVWKLCEIPNYTEQLLRCQRYQYVFSASSYVPWASGMAWNASTARFAVPLPVPMAKDNATVSYLSGSVADMFIYSNGGYEVPTALDTAAVGAGKQTANLSFTAPNQAYGRFCLLSASKPNIKILLDCNL